MVAICVGGKNRWSPGARVIVQMKTVQGPILAPFEDDIGMRIHLPTQFRIRDFGAASQDQGHFGALHLDVRRLMAGG